jgi:predicted metal-dependent peptidase
MSLYDVTTSDRIIMSKVKLQRSHPFFAYILMNMRITECSKDSFIDTMGVNEIGDLFFNAEFVKKLPQEEVNGVLAHEAMHIATQTFQREGKRDRFLWNITTDYIINYLLLKEGFTLPKTVLRPDDNGFIVIKPTPGTKEKEIKIPLDDSTFAEDLYDQLQQHRKQLMTSMNVKEVWCNCPGSGLGPGQRPGEKQQRAPGQFDWHLPGDQDDKGEGQGKLKNAADRHANEQLWKGRATEASISAKTRGKLSSSMERHVGELLEPKIDWRKKLLSFVTRDLPVDYTMRLPGRRTLATGIYFPSIVRENVEVFVAVDVSGSIGGEEYKSFLSEICGIARGFAQVKMKIIFWSTYVDPADDLEMFTANEETLLSHVVKNSGGTTMACVRDYCKEKNLQPRMIIYLTDGYVESEPKFVDNARNLFVLSAAGQDNIISKYGEVCKLSDIERDS